MRAAAHAAASPDSEAAACQADQPRRKAASLQVDADQHRRKAEAERTQPAGRQQQTPIHAQKYLGRRGRFATMAVP